MSDFLTKGIQAFASGLKSGGASRGDLTAVAATIVRTLCHEAHQKHEVKNTNDLFESPTALLQVPLEHIVAINDQLISLQRHDENNKISGHTHHFAFHAAIAAGRSRGAEHRQESLRIKRKADRSRHFASGRWQPVVAQPPAIIMDPKTKMQSMYMPTTDALSPEEELDAKAMEHDSIIIDRRRLVVVGEQHPSPMSDDGR